MSHENLESGERRDPFIEEVQELKRSASAEFRHDLDALAEELRRLESRFPGRVVDLSEGTRPQDKVA